MTNRTDGEDTDAVVNSDERSDSIVERIDAVNAGTDPSATILNPLVDANSDANNDSAVSEDITIEGLVMNIVLGDDFSNADIADAIAENNTGDSAENNTGDKVGDKVGDNATDAHDTATGVSRHPRLSEEKIRLALRFDDEEAALRKTQDEATELYGHKLKILQEAIKGVEYRNREKLCEVGSRMYKEPRDKMIKNQLYGDLQVSYDGFYKYTPAEICYIITHSRPRVVSLNTYGVWFESVRPGETRFIPHKVFSMSQGDVSSMARQCIDTAYAEKLYQDKKTLEEQRDKTRARLASIEAKIATANKHDDAPSSHAD